MRADGLQNGRVSDDLRNTQQGQHTKPHQRDGPEEFTDAGRAAFLHGKQAKQNDQRCRDDIAFEGRRNHFQSFDRRQHGNSRGDDTIAIKEGRAKNADQQEHAPQAGLVFDRL